LILLFLYLLTYLFIYLDSWSLTLCICDAKDYPLIVKTPMDLSTICRKLEDDQYDDPWQYVDDMQLMFSNAWLYNRRSSPVYKSCTKVGKRFHRSGASVTMILH